MTGIEPLKRADPWSVAQRLAAEHPQIVAAILVHLDPELAAGVLKICAERLRNDVVLRIATMKAIRPAALKDLRDVMRTVLAEPLQERETALGGISAATEIIKLMGAALEPSVMASLRENDPELARAIAARAERHGPGSGGGSGSSIVNKGSVRGNIGGVSR